MPPVVSVLGYSIHGSLLRLSQVTLETTMVRVPMLYLDDDGMLQYAFVDCPEIYENVGAFMTMVSHSLLAHDYYPRYLFVV